MSLPILKLAKISALLIGTAALIGCSTNRALMPTPTIYQGPDAEPLFSGLPPERQQPMIDVLYLTDRAEETNPESTLPYGSRRSKAIAFGSAKVEMGPDLTWAELQEQSRLGQRTTQVDLVLGEVKELGRFPKTPYSVIETPKGITYTPDVLAEHKQVTQALTKEIERRLDTAPRKEVVLYVHGFNETFESAAFSIGELCHYLGREHVCALFTWPAGSGGFILTAYGYDRESSEFGAFHLKKVIRLLTQVPGVEKIHLLSHSRGTDIMLAALRELLIETYASGLSVDVLKVSNAVFMAPDVDNEIAHQRINPLTADPDVFTVRRDKILPFGDMSNITVYTSPTDRALLGSAFLFRSRRVGNFNVDDISSESIEFWKAVDMLDAIQVPATRTDRHGHGYFSSNPLVSSDIVSVIRYGREATDPKRGLTPVTPPLLWKIESKEEQVPKNGASQIH